MQRVTDSPFKSRDSGLFLHSDGPRYRSPAAQTRMWRTACTYTHMRAHAHSLRIAPTLTGILSTKKNPNQSLKCARPYQVHCLLSLNYKTTTKKGGCNY